MKRYLLITILLFILAFAAGVATTTEAEAAQYTEYKIMYDDSGYKNWDDYGDNYEWGHYVPRPSPTVDNHYGDNYYYVPPPRDYFEPDSRPGGDNYVFIPPPTPNNDYPSDRKGGDNYIFIPPPVPNFDFMMDRRSGDNYVFGWPHQYENYDYEPIYERSAGMNYTWR